MHFLMLDEFRTMRAQTYKRIVENGCPVSNKNPVVSWLTEMPSGNVPVRYHL